MNQKFLNLPTKKIPDPEDFLTLNIQETIIPILHKLFPSSEKRGNILWLILGG